MNFLGFFYGFIDREVEDTGHGSDLFADTFSGANEHGVDKRVGSEAGFADEAAKLGRAAEAAKTGDRESHGAPGISERGGGQRSKILKSKSKVKDSAEGGRSTPTVILAGGELKGLRRCERKGFEGGW
jgi:hypothetical protein